MQRIRKCMEPRTALTRRTSREPASKSSMVIKSEISATPSGDKKRVSRELVGVEPIDLTEACSAIFGVRRGKAALSSGCKSHPANAPAGSNRSSYGGNEVAEAFGMRVTIYGDSASVQAVTRVNAEQASKRMMRRPTRPPDRGRLIRLGAVSEAIRPVAAPG